MRHRISSIASQRRSDKSSIRLLNLKQERKVFIEGRQQ